MFPLFYLREPDTLENSRIIGLLHLNNKWFMVVEKDAMGGNLWLSQLCMK